MLLSLALIRHSVLSLSEGLPKIKPYKNLSTHTIIAVHEMPSYFNNRCSSVKFRSLHKASDLSLLVFTDLSTNMGGESGRVVSKSFIAFHSLMQLWSEAMQLS